jgi:hypothetical protein
MSKTITLSSPRYRVVVGDWDDETTWRELEVQSLGRDLQMAESLFARHKDWGRPTENAIKLQAVAAFYALRRTGQVDGSWDAFESAYLEVTEAGQEVVGPTEPGPEPG